VIDKRSKTIYKKASCQVQSFIKIRLSSNSFLKFLFVFFDLVFVYYDKQQWNSRLWIAR